MTDPAIATVADLEAALDAYAVGRVTVRRAPGSGWLALAIVGRHEAVGQGPTLLAASLEVRA